jgi:hypothetical protein
MSPRHTHPQDIDDQRHYPQRTSVISQALSVLPQDSVNLGGIRAVKALRYTFGSWWSATPA